jgi:hypothetical protein
MKPTSLLAVLLTSIVISAACSKTHDPPFPRVSPPDRSTTVPLPKTMPESPVAPSPALPNPADGKTVPGKV